MIGKRFMLAYYNIGEVNVNSVEGDTMKKDVILLIGVIFIGLGIYAIWSYTKKLNRFRIDGYEAIATIVNISGMYDNHKAFITYTIEGNEYIVELNYYSNSMRVGDKVKIYVNSQNPQNYIYVGNAPIFIGALFIVIGIAMTTIWLCYLRQRK